jgi:hypothetical protein
MALRILIVLLILAVPLELPGCGPFLPEALFHFPGRPEAPKEFSRGQLGILRPSYERLYQVIAYRYMAGIGLNDAEVQSIAPGPLEPVISAPSDESRNPWLAARNQAPGVQPLKDIDAFRQVKKVGYFDSYLNCNDDAFRAAASTLQRVRSKPYAADWIAAQDMVFADCSKGANMPQPASDAQLRPDRAYQIASAKFYSEQYDAARQDFQAIGADASSPWHDVAPYLAARCSIRAGNLAQAETELQHVAADPARAQLHVPANALLGYVRARLHPTDRMHELAVELVKRNSAATIGQDLIDYRTLFDKGVKPEPGDDLTDWIVSFQAGGRGALENWRVKRTLPWLVAAMESVGPKDAATPELLSAAAAVGADSPAYLTVNYHRVRLLAESDAGTLTDQILKTDMPVSARNQFRAERMRMAQNFEDFLQYAARTPVDADAKDFDVLDGDSADILDRAIPLTLLKQASTSTLLPENTRKTLQRAVSIRTLVLDPSPDFDAVFRLLNTPGDAPFVRSGYGRWTDDPAKIDGLRDNWWCAGSQHQMLGNPPDPNRPELVAHFLSPADQQQAAAEAGKLAALPAAPDWLVAQTVAFAQAHPTDPRSPVALYLVVRASRYGCTDDKTGDFSKRAFDLLHRSYPNSEWAKKTPFWYK